MRTIKIAWIRTDFEHRACDGRCRRSSVAHPLGERAAAFGLAGPSPSAFVAWLRR